MSKSKPCFKILGKKAFRWHLETWKNQIGSIFKLNIKKSVKFQKKISSLPPPPTTFHHHPLNINFFPAPSSHQLPPPPPGKKLIFRGWWWKGVGGGGREEFFFWNLTPFFDFKFKNIYNLLTMPSNVLPLCLKQRLRIAKSSFEVKWPLRVLYSIPYLFGFVVNTHW